MSGVEQSAWRYKLWLDERLLAAVNFARTWLFRINGSAKVRRELRRTQRRWHGAEAGRHCFIVGNGPSLRSQDLTKLRRETTFFVNFFYKHDRIAEIDPQYYVVIDNKLKSGEWPLEMIDEILSKCPRAYLFLNAAWINDERFSTCLGNDRIYWILPSLQPHCDMRYNRRLDGPIFGGNVVMTSLAIAVAMGVKEIGILGVDGDGLFRDLLNRPSHFYGGERENRELNFDRLLFDLILTAYAFRGWKGAVAALDRHGIRILNYTNGGILGAMPRADFEIALARRKSAAAANRE